jgi:hypothetical protein
MPQQNLTDDEFIRQMTVGTPSAEQEEVFRALGQGDVMQKQELKSSSPRSENALPTRSEQALRAYVEAANPRASIKQQRLYPGVLGAVSGDNPDEILISSNTKQSPEAMEGTVLHELEHSLSLRGANPLGALTLTKGEPITTDNNYRFDLLYNMQGKKGKKIEKPNMADLLLLSKSGEGKKKRLTMVQNFMNNRHLIEEFFGRPIDSSYFSPNMFKAQLRSGTQGALFDEQIADLSALEQLTGKSLTRDKEMRKLLFPDDRSAEVYDAITGYRQTRLDSKDLPPYTPVSPEDPSVLDRLKGLFGKKEGGDVSNEDFIRQMTVGTPSSDQEADPDVVKDIVRGVQYTPFDVLGAPVDIATMVMRPLGYNVEKPVGGSDYFIDQAAKLGLFKSSTGSGAELLGRIAGGGATPALARGVSKVAGATEDFISNQLKGRADRRVIQEAAAKVPPDTAYDPLRDRMEQIGALTYAIKPKGGNVVSQNIQTSLDNIRPMMAVPGEGVLPPSRMFASSYAARLKDQIEKSRQAGDPTAYLEGKLSAVEPNAALDNWIQTKLSKYVRTDMGSEADPVRKLAEEMSTKVKADYEVGLKRIAKMKSDIAKAKAKNKNTDASETTLAAEIEKVEGAFRQTSLLPAALGPYTHPALRTAENREMAGFSPYPISKTNLGKEWEEIADMEFRPHKAGDLVKTNSLAFQENPWIGNLNPDEIVYTVDPYIYQKPMFTHTVDELKNALDPASGLPQRLQLKPEDMQQLSIDKAFRLVNNINDWRLEQRIALNLEEANRAAVTVKQYPGSPGNLQWQEIKAPTYTELPPGYTIEKLDDATSVLKGPDGKSLTYFGATDGPASNHQKEALSFLSKNDLERALKYEGSTMRHCVGGYCDDVWSGRTRTYSLRDSKGEPHVTIETAPADIRRNGNTPRDFIDSLGLENLSEFSSRYGIDKNEINNLFYKDQPLDTVQVSRKIIASPEFQQWLKSRPDEILQIKGKANEKPIKKYIPFVQDFVLSGKWSSVGDIRNAELNKLDRGGKLLRELSEEGYDISKIPQYVTDEELKELMKIRMNFESNRALKKLDKKAAGGEVSNADFIEQMTVGTRPTDQETSGSFIGKKLDELGISPADFLLMAGKFPSALGLALTPTPAGAGEEEELARLRGLAAQETATTEGGTAKALLQAVKSKNPAAAVKAISEVTKAKPKSLTKKDLQGIASELETSRGQLAEIVKKYPQLRDASIADVEALTKGDPFTAYRGISLLPGRELRREEIPSMTMDPSVALSMIKDAPVMMTKEGFITATPVLRQYPGMQASETQIYVPSLIEQISERQPGALEMKIPTRSGEKMTVADIFKEVKGEKELLADVSKKEPQDVLFNRYQGGVGDRYLMEVARKVLAGKYEGGESLVKEIGGYQTDPKALAQEFDEFAEMVKKRVAIKKAKGGEMTNNDFIRNRQEGSPQEGEVANDDFIQQMMTGTPPTDQEADPDVVKDIVRGAQYTPFDLLGAPVDIATMAIRPFGYNVEKPVGGSEYFIDQAAKLGLFKPSTGSAAELLGRIGGGGATPAIARGITKAADATGDFISGQLKGRADRQAVQQAAAKVPPDTAYDPLRDRMEQIGALTYAVKPTPAPVAQAPKNQMGFYSAVEDTILRLPQEKGTAQQFLAQISKAPGVKQGEIKATGLEDFLKSKGTGPVTKEEVRSFLDSNKVQVDEVVLGAGKVLSPEAKRLSDAAFSRMEEADNKWPRFLNRY